MGLGNFGCRTFTRPRYVNQYCALTNIQATTDWLDLTVLRDNYQTEKQNNSPDAGFAHQFLCIAEQSCSNFEAAGAGGWAGGFVKYLFDNMDDENGIPQSVETNCFNWMSSEACFRYKGYIFHSDELYEGFKGYCIQEGVLVDYERWDSDHESFLDKGVSACFADVANAGDIAPQFAADYATTIPKRARLLREGTQKVCRTWNFIRSSGAETGRGNLNVLELVKDTKNNTKSVTTKNSVLPDELRGESPIREDFYDANWEDEGGLTISMTDNTLFVKPGDQINASVTGESADGSQVSLSSVDGLQFRLLTNNKHASISSEGVLTVLSTPSPFSSYSLADVILVIAVAGNEYGIGQLMIIDNDTDEDTLFDTYEDINGFDTFTTNNVFEDSDNNGIDDIEEALNYISSSSQDDSLNVSLLNSLEGDSDDVIGINPQAPGRSSGGAANGYLITLLIFACVYRRRILLVNHLIRAA